MELIALPEKHDYDTTKDWTTCPPILNYQGWAQIGTNEVPTVGKTRKQDCMICLDSRPIGNMRWCRVCNANGICATCWRSLTKEDSTSSIHLIPRDGDSAHKDTIKRNASCPTCRSEGMFSAKGHKATKVILIPNSAPSSYWIGENYRLPCWSKDIKLRQSLRDVETGLLSIVKSVHTIKDRIELVEQYNAEVLKRDEYVVMVKEWEERDRQIKELVRINNLLENKTRDYRSTHINPQPIDDVLCSSWGLSYIIGIKMGLSNFAKRMKTSNRETDVRRQLFHLREALRLTDYSGEEEEDITTGRFYPSMDKKVDKVMLELFLKETDEDKIKDFITNIAPSEYSNDIFRQGIMTPQALSQICGYNTTAYSQTLYLGADMGTVSGRVFDCEDYKEINTIMNGVNKLIRDLDKRASDIQYGVIKPELAEKPEYSEAELLAMLEKVRAKK